MFGGTEYNKPLNSQIFKKINNAVNIKLNKEINIRNSNKDDTEKVKAELLDPIFLEINNLLSDPENPRKALRLNIIKALNSLSLFEILLPSEKALVYTSGDLHMYLPQLLKSNERILNTLIPYGITEQSSKEDIVQAIKKHLKGLSIRIKALNTARKEIGDYNKDKKKDWFNFCYISFSVYHEENLRKSLNLNSIMVGKNKEVRLQVYSAWNEIAEEDVSNMFTAWEEYLDIYKLKNIFDV